MKRSPLTALAALALALALGGCGGDGRRQSLVRFAPADSFAVLAVNWAAVRDDRELRGLVKSDDVEKVLGEAGVGSDELTDLLLFSDIDGTRAGSSGVVFKGAFKARDALLRLKGRGWSSETVAGAEVYRHPREESYVARLGDGTLAAGTRRGVEGALRARADEGASFVSNGSYRQLSSGFRGERPALALAVALPQAAQDAADAAVQVSATVLDIGGLGPLGDLLSKVGYARGFGCSVARDGDHYPLKLVAVMKDERSATLVSGAINLLKGAASLAPRNDLSSADAERLNSVRDMKVTREREVLSVRVRLAREDVTAAAAGR